MKIIAFSAKKQGGKTTAVDGLVDGLILAGKSYIKINFADYLKEIVARCFFGEPEFREEMKWEIACGKTGREWLQIVGTDWFRKANS